MGNQATTFFKALIASFSRERLEEDAPPPPVQTEGFFTWLFKAEELPKAAVYVEPPRRGILSWLLGPDEKLPEDESTHPRRPSIFSVIFGRDDVSELNDHVKNHQKVPPGGRKEYNRAEEE